jgi:hypothetical protein
MSQLTIVDLDFCENQIPSHRTVKGGLGFGITIYGPTGSFSTSASSDKSSGYSVGHFFDPRTGAYGYSVGYGYAGAVAGAAAGAASDGGYRYVSAYSGVFTY